MSGRPVRSRLLGVVAVVFLACVTAVTAVTAVAPSAGAASSGGSSGASTATVRRVLIISLPATSWADVKAADAPNLQRLFSQSAIADMVTRTAGRRSSIAAGYTALGAGGRASAVTPLATQAFETSEPYGQSTAGDVYRQRTGRRVTSGIVHLGIEALKDENTSGLFNPQLGALGDALAGAGEPRAVIANADGAQATVDDPLPEFQRSAVNALMGNDGTVPSGTVGDELLVADPHAPFGLRMDNDVAYRAFASAWQAGGVVLVEGSDLLRADLYGDFATSQQLRVERLAALQRTDELVGRMLADLDPQHDAVFVVGPAASRKGSGLTVAAIRASGVSPDLLRSATSRRTGFVYTIDIAPTVLQMLGIKVPTKMEGETMEVAGSGGTGRIERLIHANTDAVFRDNKVTAVTNLVIVLSIVLALFAVLVVARAPRRARLGRWFALWLLGFLFATYLAGPLHFGRSGNNLAYFGFLIAAAVVFAALCMAFERRHPYLPLAAALAATVVLHVGDLLAGARLELDTVFGYSATVGIRVSGQGNLTFSQLTAAVVLLAGLLVWRRPGRRTILAVIAMLAVTLVVMAAPPFGGDFGSALAGAPAFGLLAWLLLGRKVRVRTVAILGGVVVAAGLAVGFVDLMRPKDQQTHVGRFFDQVANGGLGDFTLTVRRKLLENVAAFTSTKFIWVLPVVAALLVCLWRSPRGRIRRLFGEVAVLRHTMLALAVAAFLGYALNDSGIAIPSLMAIVLECAVVYVAFVPDDEAAPDPPGPEPRELAYAGSRDSV